MCLFFCNVIPHQYNSNIHLTTYTDLLLTNWSRHRYAYDNAYKSVFVVLFQIKSQINFLGINENWNVCYIMFFLATSRFWERYIMTELCNSMSYNGLRMDMRRYSSVGIAIEYGPDDRRVGFRVPVGWRTFLLHVVQTGSGAYPASYPVGSTGSFPGGKTAGGEADHSPPATAEVKEM
jgi:hypothetical protein